MDGLGTETSLTVPDRFFLKAQQKIEKGDYDFNVDGPN